MEWSQQTGYDPRTKKTTERQSALHLPTQQQKMTLMQSFLPQSSHKGSSGWLIPPLDGMVALPTIPGEPWIKSKRDRVSKNKQPEELLTFPAGLKMPHPPTHTDNQCGQGADLVSLYCWGSDNPLAYPEAHEKTGRSSKKVPATIRSPI